MTSSSLGDRLRAGLRRTREKLGASLGASDAPDWEALEESLVLADVGLEATEAILEGMRARSGSTEVRLREELLGILRRVRTAAAPTTPQQSPCVSLVIGVNGVGKTTTVAKLAHQSVASGRKAMVVAADTFRAAAQEQLASWAERIGVDLFEGESGSDPASVVHDGLQAALARKADDVFVDTAGRLHTRRPLMDELGKIERVASRAAPEAFQETLLVMDGTVGSNGLAQARQFAASLSVSGIILTKMDGTAKGGVVIAIARELDLPVRFVGIGESVDDLVAFSPEEFVDALLS